MSFAYTRAIEKLPDWESLDVRAILLDATSTAGDDEDVATVGAIATLGEVTGTGYSRLQLTGNVLTVNVDDDRIDLTANHLSYGGPDVGEIAAILLYEHVTDDSDSAPLIYLDNGFLVTMAAPAGAGDETVYVDPLVDRILTGATLSFPSEDATLTATAQPGDRQLSVAPLPGAIAIGESAHSPTPGFPIATNGSPLTITFPDPLLTLEALR